MLRPRRVRCLLFSLQDGTVELLFWTEGAPTAAGKSRRPVDLPLTRRVVAGLFTSNEKMKIGDFHREELAVHLRAIACPCLKQHLPIGPFLVVFANGLSLCGNSGITDEG